MTEKEFFTQLGIPTPPYLPVDRPDELLAAVERIGTATRPIWKLDETNQAALELLAAARDLETHGAAIATALGGPGPARRTPA